MKTFIPALLLIVYAVCTIPDGQYKLVSATGTVRMKEVTVRLNSGVLSFKYCNYHRAGFSQDGNTIKFQNFMSTRMYCPYFQTMENEHALLNGFGASVKSIFDGQKYTLVDSENQVQIVLEKN